jgi:hypothetical protein
MSKNPAPRVMFNFMENDVEEDIPDIITESIEDDDDESISGLAMPTPIEREEIKQDIIFDVPEEKNQILKDLIEKELPKPKKEPKKKEPKLTKSGRPRKPLSEEQKQRLALGRQRALEVRRQKKIEREEEKALAKQESDLLKKKKQMDLEKLKKEVEDPKPSPAPQPQPQPQGVFLTPKQLEETQLSAILSYEKIRKDRKKAKQEQQLIEQQKQEIRNKLTKPVGHQSAYNPSNRFYNYY